MSSNSPCVILAAVMALAAISSPAQALYGSDSKVKVLTARNFKSAVIDSDIPAMVEFFAPWCGHCKQLSPTYSKVAENLHGIVTIGAVDCEVDSNKPLCGQYGVQGFPTLKLFPANRRMNSQTGKTNKSPEDYNGQRSAKAIADAATAGLTGKFIERIATESDLDKFRASTKMHKVVLVTKKKSTSTLYKSLSMRFRGRLAFAETKDPGGDIAEGLGVEHPPTLLVIPTKGDIVAYKGKFNAKDLVEFLKPWAGAKGGEPAERDGKAAKDRELPLPVEDQTIALPDLQLADVDAILDGDAAWLLATFRGGDGAACSAEAIKLAQAARALGSLAKVGRINATAVGDGRVAERGLAAAPAGAACTHALSLKPFGEQSEPEEAFPIFTGNVSAPKEVQAFVLAGFSAAGVVPLTEAAVETFMSAGEGLKVLLFTNKETTPRVFAALAANTQREIGASFATVHQRETAILENFKVKAVPKMMVAWTEESESKDEQGRPMVGARLQSYQGPLKYERMLDFLRLLSTMVADKRAGGGGMSAVPGAPLLQANTTSDWESLCTRGVSLCAVGMLNPAMGDHPERVAHLGIQALKRFDKISFLWIDLRQQPDFAKVFNVTLRDAPTAVVVAPRKRRWAPLPGGLDAGARGLDQLLERVLAGKQRTVLLPELPAFAEVAPVEDGSNSGGAPSEEAAPAEAEVELEDEFDLADLMAEETGCAAKSNADRLAEVDAQIQAEAEAKRKLEAKAAKAAEKAKTAAASKAAAEARAERKRKREAAAAAATAAAAEASARASDEL